MSAEWPVVFHESLLDSDIERNMKTKNPSFKTKHSRALLHNVILFPLSSVAFLVVYLDEVLMNWVDGEKRISPELVDRITKFHENHQHPYVLAVAAMHNTTEQNALRELQNNYQNTSLSFLPVHNAPECVDVMTSIAKVMCKPLSDVVQQRYQQFVDKQSSEETVLDVMRCVGVDMHDCFVLTDGCGSLADIARAPVDKLVECTLEPSTAEMVVKFFTEQDFIP
jgi:hypothetical protein